jgi:hypothetical protein
MISFVQMRLERAQVYEILTRIGAMSVEQIQEEEDLIDNGEPHEMKITMPVRIHCIRCRISHHRRPHRSMEC